MRTKIRNGIALGALTLTAVFTMGMAPAPRITMNRPSFPTAKQPYFAYYSETDKVPCIPQDEARFLISKYSIRIETFRSSRGSLNAELCRRNSKVRKLLEAVRILEFAQFKPYPSGFVNEHYSDFFLDRSTEITALSGNAQCQGRGALACHATTKGPTWVGDALFNHPPLIIAGTLLHEARHADGYDHVECNNPRIGNMREGCDPSYDLGGSYGVQAEFMARVATHGTNFDTTIIETARNAALSYIEDHFNRPSHLERRRGFEGIQGTSPSSATQSIESVHETDPTIMEMPPNWR